MIDPKYAEYLERQLPELEAREKGPVEPYPTYSSKLKEIEARYPGLKPSAIKGRYKYLNKYKQMRIKYLNSIDDMKDSYNNLPFGPETKKAYMDAIDDEAHRKYSNKVIVSHEKKWAANWMRGVSK